jgi:hypothetical protein
MEYPSFAPVFSGVVSGRASGLSFPDPEAPRTRGRWHMAILVEIEVERDAPEKLLSFAQVCACCGSAAETKTRVVFVEQEFFGKVEPNTTAE